MNRFRVLCFLSLEKAGMVEVFLSLVLNSPILDFQRDIDITKCIP